MKLSHIPSEQWQTGLVKRKEKFSSVTCLHVQPQYLQLAGQP